VTELNDDDTLLGNGGADDSGSNSDLPVMDQTTAPKDAEDSDFPKNEFEAMKEGVLGGTAGALPDEVTVNEDAINDDDNPDGTLLHEHTNYDTAVFNHPGGPYLTDVENARTEAYRERRMLQNEDATASDRQLDAEAALSADDVSAALSEQRDGNNSAFAERETKLREAGDANVREGMLENAETGKSVEDILKDNGLDPQGSPSGVNPAPAPEDTVPGLSGDEVNGAPDSADGSDVPDAPDTVTQTSPNATSASGKKKR
jgi:hypothetical protein